MKQQLPDLMPCLLCAAFWFFGGNLLAQDYSKVDAHARATPAPKNQNIQQLADALAKGLTTEKEKARAAYVWIANTIQYDVKSFEKIKDIDPADWAANQVPTQVLKNKKAVCDGYSNLFSALCGAMGLEVIKVAGITKNHRGRIPRSSHAWNLVRADGEWAFVDATWGAGEVDTDEGKYHKRFKEDYFFTPPATMILNHFPDDPLFQLLPKPLTLEAFKQDQASLQKTLDDPLRTSPLHFENVQDSLNAFVKQDADVVASQSSMRSLAMDPTSPKGLYGLARLQHDEAYRRYLECVDETNVALQSQNKQAKIEALERNKAKLVETEALLDECRTTIERISGTSSYFKSSRELLTSARKVHQECNKVKNHIDKAVAQLKG